MTPHNLFASPSHPPTYAEHYNFDVRDSAVRFWSASRKGPGILDGFCVSESTNTCTKWPVAAASVAVLLPKMPTSYTTLELPIFRTRRPALRVCVAQCTEDDVSGSTWWRGGRADWWASGRPGGLADLRVCERGKVLARALHAKTDRVRAERVKTAMLDEVRVDDRVDE